MMVWFEGMSLPVADLDRSVAFDDLDGLYEDLLARGLRSH